jgi:CheY-like chemotaxis protein
MDSRPNILIVEKEEVEVNRLKTILGGLYNIDIIKTTTEAITKVSENKDKYSIIIVSLNMPVLNGYLFCYSLKKDINVRSIPVIITGTIVDFNKTEPVEGLRIGEYDRLINPFDNKIVIDLLEINIEKKKMLERLNSRDIIEKTTGLFNFEYFKEALNIEIMKANKLNTSLNCLNIVVWEPEVKENLLAVIKNTHRYYDVIAFHQNRILLLLPRTTQREGELIANRFNSVIYGLNTRIFFYEPNKTDVMEFKSDVLGYDDVPTLR